MIDHRWASGRINAAPETLAVASYLSSGDWRPLSTNSGSDGGGLCRLIRSASPRHPAADPSRLACVQGWQGSLGALAHLRVDGSKCAPSSNMSSEFCNGRLSVWPSH